MPLRAGVLPSAFITTSASTTNPFRGSITPAYTLPVYASQHRLPWATQHSVPDAGTLIRAGLDYPLGSSEKFQSSTYVIKLLPISQAWPGALQMGPDPFFLR